MLIVANPGKQIRIWRPELLKRFIAAVFSACVSKSNAHAVLF